MKKGTIVRICDGSFMFTVENGLITAYPKRGKFIIGHCTDPFEVVDDDFNVCVQPMYVGYPFPSKEKNRIDTVIRNMNTFELWYCNANISLREIDPPKVIAEYTMAELQSRIGHEFKIKK